VGAGTGEGWHHRFYRVATAYVMVVKHLRVTVAVAVCPVLLIALSFLLNVWIL